MYGQAVGTNGLVGASTIKLMAFTPNARDALETYRFAIYRGTTARRSRIDTKKR